MRSRLSCLLIGAFVAGGFLTRAQDEPPPVPAEETAAAGVEVQARGPVHEAFAEPTDANPAPGIVVSKEPPAPIEEAPPEEKPEGDNVIWIPGYWAWDDDTNDFLWVSGFWRAAPPNRQWVPGHWQQVEDGWQWTAGYWGDPGREEEEYLPAPPASLDTGPSAPAPSATSTYVPGCWIFRADHFVWRPGYWVRYRPGWVWVPSRYQWTPAGYLFVQGFWDHPIGDRGLLFAPVRFERRLLRPRFVHRPRFVVQPDFLISALFVRPNHRQFYFGDYFEKRYQKAGFVPWVDYRPARGSYDPNYAYYRHAFAAHPSWERNLRSLYAGRYNGDVPRPPRTLVQQNTVIKNITTKKITNVTVNKTINVTNVQNVSVLAPVTRVNKTQVTALASLARLRPAEVKALPVVRQVRVARAPKEQLAHEQKAISHYRAVAQQRRDVQAKLIGKAPAAKGPPAVKGPPTKKEPPVVKHPPPVKGPPAVKAPPPARVKAPTRVSVPTLKTVPPTAIRQGKPPPPPARPNVSNKPEHKVPIPKAPPKPPPPKKPPPKHVPKS
jgi:hypothetical protein